MEIKIRGRVRNPVILEKNKAPKHKAEATRECPPSGRPSRLTDMTNRQSPVIKK
jgi:hypothetical protein